MTTTLITGANKGLGKETARQLIAAGHTVYIGAAVLQRSGNPVLVNVSSALGSFGAVNDPDRPAHHFRSIVYGASKAAVSMLTLQYARTYPGCPGELVAGAQCNSHTGARVWNGITLRSAAPASMRTRYALPSGDHCRLSAT